MKEPGKPTFRVSCAGLDLTFEIVGTQRLRINDRQMTVAGHRQYVTITVVQNEGRWTVDYLYLSGAEDVAAALRAELPAAVTDAELKRGRSIAERYAAYKVNLAGQTAEHARRQVRAWTTTVTEAERDQQRWTERLAEYKNAPPLPAQPVLAATVDLPGVGLAELD